MKKSQYATVFFGTPEFAVPILEKLAASPYRPALVVTMPDQPTGRKQTLAPPPVKVSAQGLGISVAQPQTRKELLSLFSEQRTANNEQYDLFVVAAYGKILPKEILSIPRHGTLNVHPSLLPQWRGPSPIQYAILNGDKETGVSIMLLDEEMDHGPILANKELGIRNDDTTETLSKKLAEMGGDLLLDTIPRWLEGEVTQREQDHAQATYSKIITKEDGRIDWNKSAQEIERTLRAFTPWPGIYTTWNGKRIKILEAHVQKSEFTLSSTAVDERVNSNSPVGTVLRDSAQKIIGVQTGNGVLDLGKVQLEGKKSMTAEEFLRGYPEFGNALLV